MAGENTCCCCLDIYVSSDDQTQQQTRTCTRSFPFSQSIIISQTVGKFMDLQFARNRRLAATTHRVRPWFVSSAKWLEGTRAVADSPPAVLFGDEEVRASA